ncbi:MAG: hypothetical protein EXQ50_13020 [Acidobacteria bacterium]|nr:hypothetical protein [Acidobacteriota bacterium]MSO62989.1 hypothetical protein [Acidobacteriota bacterium]
MTRSTLPISAVLSGLSAALDSTEGHPRGHAALESADLNATVAAAEPAERAIDATAERLDQFATAFAWVIDAKSSFTFKHSDRVSSIAVAMEQRMGLAAGQQTRLTR